MKTTEKKFFFFIAAPALLNISIGYTEFIKTTNGCKTFFIKSTFQDLKEDTVDHLKKLLPKDSEIQKEILIFQNKAKNNPYINYAIPTNIEQSVFTETNQSFLIRTIISQPQLINFRDKNGRNLLHLAVIYNNVKLSKFLTQFTKLLNKKDIAGNTPLLLSMTRMQSIDIFKLLVTHPLIDFSARDSFEQNILHYIFLGKKNYRNEMLDLLLEHLDLNMVSNLTKAVNKQGESPLNYLIRDFDITIANKFIKAVPANFLQKLKNGNTLLHTASSIPNLKAIKFLLEHSNQINEANHLGQTPAQILKSYHPSLTDRDISILSMNNKKRSQL